MSICPDKIVISEYVDGQLPSPWDEKLKTHLAECEECRSYYEKHKQYSEVLRGMGREVVEGFDYNLSLQKLNAKLHSKKAFEKDIETTDKSFWQKTVRMPIPIIAAAALIMVFLPASTFFALKSKQEHMPSFAFPAFQNLPSKAQNASTTKKRKDMNSAVSSFFKLYMSNENPNANFIVIDMPTDTFSLEQYKSFFQQLESEQVQSIEAIETKDTNE